MKPCTCFRTPILEWQNGTTYRRNYARNNIAEVPFTLEHNEYFTFVNGNSSMSDYHATVVLKQGQVDLKGTVFVTCSADWAKHLVDCKETGFDMILNWNLYQNDKTD